RLAMAYARAVNEELRELEPVLDWIQLDEPYLEARADHAKAYAVPAIDRALAGLRKPTCVHVCFGYAFSHALAGTSKSGGYRFALELERSTATHLSLEAAQPRLDLASLAAIRGKTVVLGVLDLGASTPETADVVAARLREALRHVPAERLVAAPDCGMKYLDRPSARACLRALVEGARNRMGYAALVVDSFTGRGVKEICTGHASVNPGSRLADLFRAQELLVTHPRIDAQRIGVLGFSHGGWVGLWASQAWYQRRFMR